ncbi:cytidine deaminase [Nocardioides zeae]|uniref:Cytidine deaminase n=1 Tax=Nocardioides imazamoxiresistens TaxID=3231893 RepID=A0ABU3Q2G0_9ACTN|nr:cytidine deaminase [Nocardioides zeae]MDT9595227.1 cytidine deaminase [Nocardioides zeae]
MTVELAAEDQKLVTLARATRARARATQGAAVRDQDGRTYAAAAVALPSLQVSAVAGCLAMAVSSGARSLEAVVLLADTDVADEADLAALRDFTGADVPVHLGDARGVVDVTVTT